MTMDLANIMRYKIPNKQKLLDYGFAEKDATLEKKVPIMQGQFYVYIVINAEGNMNYKVMDSTFNEEYVLLHVPHVKGSFISEVQKACEKVLTALIDACFDTEMQKAEQAKRIIANISHTYAIQPEFLWERHPTYAVFRRKDNKKWFAILMTIEKNKLGMPGDGSIEVMNLKADPPKVEELLKKNAYYPGYHMNKKHWYTLCLDGSITDKTISTLISNSYQCAKPKSPNRSQPTC